nr:PAAR domain-containing protein [Enterococcus faecium]
MVSGSSKFICEGDPVARTGDTTGCGASLISGATKWSCD